MTPLTLAVAALLTFFAGSVAAEPNENANEHAKQVFAYWTKERIDSAQPRDFLIEKKEPDGHGPPAPKVVQLLTENGNRNRALVPESAAKAQKNESDRRLVPVITGLSPGQNDDIQGPIFTASAHITDSDATLRSVKVYFPLSGQSFDMPNQSGDTYAITLSYSGSGELCYYVEAISRGQGGTTTTTTNICFNIDVAGPPVTDTCNPIADLQDCPLEIWPKDTDMAGRLYFEMPNHQNKKFWSGYVCSGTSATTSITDRSIIITAAHCVYDDQYNAFARNVLFIPNQEGGGAGTDLNCNNDPYGCWAPSFGVVDVEQTTHQFPANIPWDYVSIRYILAWVNRERRFSLKSMN
jgi:hypothetical protein